MSSQTELPRDSTELLDRIRISWFELQESYIKASELELERLKDPGGWSVIDHLAHLAAWERWLVQHHISGFPAGLVLQLKQEDVENLSADHINTILHARSQGRSAGEILRELLESHTQVMQTLEAIDYKELLKPHYPDDPENRPLLLWVIGNTYEHYQEHAQTIRKLLRTGKAHG